METAQSGAATGASAVSSGPGQRGATFHGGDPHTVAADTICKESPTQCQVRTRVYRDGQLVKQGFPVAQISDHLADADTTIWLDLRDPDRDDLLVLQDEFGLHPVAIEDALFDRERPKIDRYETHLFMTVYSARLDTTTGELATSELSVFVLPQALITIRKDDGLDIGKVVERWDSSPTWPSTASASSSTDCSTSSWTAISRRCSRSTTRSRSRGQPVRRHAQKCPCTGDRSSSASPWCCCAGSCFRCAKC